jgi:Acyl-CoA thioester hydrolase/BAAT N-terminal region
MFARVAAQADLGVTPGRALNDEPVEIRVSGLRPHATATLRARMVDDFGREWKSEATFVADGSGVISPSSHAPIEGAYESVDPMGLFWSMVPADGRMVSGLTKNGVAPTAVILTAEIDG